MSADPGRSQTFALVMREAPGQPGCGYSTGVLATVLDEHGRRVGEHWSSSTSFARKDADAIASRLGGSIDQAHALDLTVFGRPWVQLPTVGQHGCVACGCAVWDQFSHVRHCPPGQEYEDAPTDDASSHAVER